MTYVDHAKMPSPILHAMATCHTIAVHAGELLGDPLDIEMFKSSEWILADDPSSGSVVVSSKFSQESFSILKYFEFSSVLQRMSVIARHNPSGDVYVFCKGAPETLKSFCEPETIPTNFDSVLTSYTHQGKRVIALSSKNLGAISVAAAAKLTRQESESALYFQVRVAHNYCL